MSNLPLGKIITTEQHNDAIHVAVAPVEAGERLMPGVHVKLRDGKAFAGDNTVGIVDPFLREFLMPGDRFWLFLYPGTVTSLRHEWTHPAFEPVKPKIVDRSAVEIRLREIAEAIDIGYKQMLNAAEQWLEYEEYETQQGSETWRDEFPAYAEEFWNLYATLTGKEIPPEKRTSFFSCSC